METEIKMDNQYYYCSCNCTLPSMTGSTECCKNCSNRYGYAPYSTKIEDTTMKTYAYEDTTNTGYSAKHYCVDKGIACSNANSQGYCTLTACCNQYITYSGGKGNSTAYTFKKDDTKIEDTTINDYAYADSILNTKMYKEDYEMEERRDIYKVYDRNGYVATFNNIIDALTFIDACNSKYYNQVDWQYTIKRIDDSVKCAVEE